VKITYSTLRTPPSRCPRSSDGASSNGTPAAAIVFFARVIRACTVGTGTRNARAISALARPPTTRSVKATRASGDSTGWQATNISARMSSSTRSRSHGRSCDRPRAATARARRTLGELAGEQGVPLVACRAAAEAVDGAPPRGRQQPTHRVARRTLARPGDQRLRHRLRRDVLGEREVGGVAGQRTHDPRGLDPPDRLDGPPRRLRARRAAAGRGHQS
jgi:hypothetical protein